MSLGEIGAKLAGSPHRKWLTLSTTGGRTRASGYTFRSIIITYHILERIGCNQGIEKVRMLLLLFSFDNWRWLYLSNYSNVLLYSVY